MCAQKASKSRTPSRRVNQAALLQIRGDWEWLCEAFQFRHYGSEEFCFLCDATQSGPLSYFDFTERAAHRSTLVTHERYLADCVRYGLLCNAILLDTRSVHAAR